MATIRAHADACRRVRSRAEVVDSLKRVRHCQRRAISVMTVGIPPVHCGRLCRPSFSVYGPPASTTLRVRSRARAGDHTNRTAPAFPSDSHHAMPGRLATPDHVILNSVAAATCTTACRPTNRVICLKSSLAKSSKGRFECQPIVRQPGYLSHPGEAPPKHTGFYESDLPLCASSCRLSPSRVGEFGSFGRLPRLTTGLRIVSAFSSPRRSVAQCLLILIPSTLRSDAESDQNVSAVSGN